VRLVAAGRGTAGNWLAVRLGDQAAGALEPLLEPVEMRPARQGAQGWAFWLPAPARNERNSAPGERWVIHNSDRS